MCAISGFEGLRPTIDVIKFTKVIAIANKESIICGWNLIKKKLHKYKTKFIPIDSEHFSIWSLIGESRNINFEKIYLTASGGPFRTYPLNQFKNITPKEALKHPNWLMGKKISIDSATMMNKVFEIIEAKKIFDLDYKQLQILIHPQSYLHAIVKFNNGLTKFLVHDTNMTIPIFNSINFDNRKILLSKPLNLKILNNLSLENVNKIRFPLVKVIDKLTNFDSLFDTVVVCANDLLVSKFLNGDIKFIDISKILLKILSLKEFKKYKKIQPKKINDIQIISKLVSLKIASLGV
jgi:1-deoxy-D-xylulose-5-phosphate reductoisomerase